MKIRPENLVLESLPYLTLAESKSLPDVSAIYFAESNGEILYIGMTKCLVNRWHFHHVYKKVSGKPNTKIRWLELSVKSLRKTEKAMIEFFKPSLNYIRTPKKQDVSVVRAYKSDRQDFKVLAYEAGLTMQDYFAEIVKKLKHGGRV